MLILNTHKMDTYSILGKYMNFFLHFRNAQSPCNTEYQHESAIAHSLARAKHRKMLNDMELNQFSDVSQYYQQNIDRMTKSARYVVFSWKKKF